MENEFAREALLIGKDKVNKLHEKRVLIFGVGGVGGYVTEGLARCGVGHFMLVDNDTVSITNINRQIIALHSTLGKMKTEVMAERIKDMNPSSEVMARNCFFLPENSAEFDFSSFDYVVDAVDTVSAKIAIIEKAKQEGVPVISAMGAGNKTDSTKFLVSDINQTEMDPLARVMRYELKKRGIKGVKVVYSKEKPMEAEETYSESGKRTPGSMVFAPASAGLLMASEIIKDFLKEEEHD